jgi:coenzyme F420-0:L-glutamate ligase/coenzyme F420-1:gamma-L-glutamate ligase
VAAGAAVLLKTAPSVQLLPVIGMPEVEPGDDLVALVGGAIAASVGALVDGDIVVLASKVVSKAEGMRVTENPAPGAEAQRLSGITGFDPGEVELILSQSRAVLRTAPGVLVVETVHGFVCANAGVDRSNTGDATSALLLPVDSDASARRLRDGLAGRFGAAIALLVSDTFGRPFRYGLVNVALGVAGMDAIHDYRGEVDPGGRTLKGTELAVADELCGAAELVMNKLDRVPAAVIRGYAFTAAQGTAGVLMRDPAQDYFR